MPTHPRLGRAASLAALFPVRKTVGALARNGTAASDLPFGSALDLRPHLPGRRYGWTHFGVMIPDLPEPDRYLSVMIIAGNPGMRAFDVDEAARTSPRDTVALSVSTAAEGAAHYRTMSLSRECAFGPAGDRQDFGGDVRFHGKHPDIAVDVETGAVSARLRFSLAPLATWFAKSWPYDHLSFRGDYSGWVETSAGRRAVSGMGNIEYARCVGPHSLVDRPLPWAAKIPLDFFTYHVVSLSDDAQLLFARVGALGEPVGDLVVSRTRDGWGDWRVNDVKDGRGERAFYEVVEHAAQPLVDADGRGMLLPKRFRLGVEGRIEVVGTYDSPYRYGVGRGYIGGYTAEVRADGTTAAARGYAEYVDVRA